MKLLCIMYPNKLTITPLPGFITSPLYFNRKLHDIDQEIPVWSIVGLSAWPFWALCSPKKFSRGSWFDSNTWAWLPGNLLNKVLQYDLKPRIIDITSNFVFKLRNLLFLSTGFSWESDFTSSSHVMIHSIQLSFSNNRGSSSDLLWRKIIRRN